MPSRLPALSIPLALVAAVLVSSVWRPASQPVLSRGAAHFVPAPSADAAVAAPARIEARIALLDARFAAEPVDAAWAAGQEHALREFLAPPAPLDDGLRAPDVLQTSCHRSTCRISAHYSDPLVAEIATQQLALHFADRLPYGAVVPQTLDDGGIRIDAWYSSTPMMQ